MPTLNQLQTGADMLMRRAIAGGGIVPRTPAMQMGNPMQNLTREETDALKRVLGGMQKMKFGLPKMGPLGKLFK